MEFKPSHRKLHPASMIVQTAFVFFGIVMNSNIAKGEVYPVFTKPLPGGQRPATMFKQPDFHPSPVEAQRAYDCATLPCDDREHEDVLCACNFNTGKVVTFKNGCDLKKHNCRFLTDFRAILGQVCPWEFQSRRKNTEFVIDYNNPNYYN